MAQGDSQEFRAAGSPPFDECRGTGAMTIPVFADAALPDGSSATATVNVKIAAKPPTKDCKPKDAGAWGDPHMWSFDGTHWEGQFVGEYVYSQSTPGAAVEQRLVVRTSPTNSSAPPSTSPTSVRAIAFDVDGHRLELYTGASTPELLLDGVLTTMAVNEVRTVGDHLSVVRTGTVNYRVDGDGLGFTMRQYGSIFDLEVSATTASSIVGLLGSPDDDASNDFTTPDGTVFTPAQIQESWANVISFQTFVGSWRITDVAQSPFSRQDPVIFAAANPGYDPAVVEEFGPQVDAIFAQAALVCATPPALVDRDRYRMALELSIGTPVEQLLQYTCRYSVGGVAQSQGSPVPGLQVTVDGTGIQPCVATTSADGSYSCLAMPDLVEAAANPPATPTPADPFELSVVATWPTRPDVVATGTAEFLEFSPTYGSPANATVDLEIDPDSLPWLDLSGTFVIDGVPQVGAHTIRVELYDQDGRFTDWEDHSVTPGANGGWSLHLALSPTVGRATATALFFTPLLESVVGTIADVQLGSNPLVLDADVTLRRLHVAGSMTDGTNPLGPQPVSVFVRSASAGLSGVATPTVTPAADGTYVLDVVLPLSATSAYVSAFVGVRGERFQSAEVPVADGTTNLTWDVLHRPAVVDLTGSVTGTAGQTVRVDVRFYQGATMLGSSRSQVALDAQGRYTTSVVGYTTADRVVAVLDLANGADTYTKEFTGIVQGPNALTWDLAATPVLLSVSGRMVDDTTGLALPGPVYVATQFQDAANQVITSIGTNVTPASDGSYTMSLIGDHTAVKATFLAYAGADQFTKTVTGLAPGANTAVFDVGLRAPVVGVSGLLTTGTPAVGRTGFYRAVLTAYNAAGGIVTTRTQYVTVQADGSYSFGPYQLPSTVMSVALVIEIGGGNNGWPGDWLHLPQTPVGPGTNELTLSDVYDPPTLHLSGVAEWNDVPVTSLYVQAQAWRADGSLITWIYPTATLSGGRYDVPIVLPLGTDDVSVTLRDTSTGRYDVAVSTYEVDFGPTEDRSVTLDFDQHPVHLALSGQLWIFGEAPKGVTIRTVGLDVNGQQTGQANAYPTVGADGSYSASVDLPEGTVQALVWADGYPSDSSRSYGFPGQWFTGLTSGSQPIAYSATLRGIRVGGTVLRDGSPLPTLPWNLPVTVSWGGGALGTNASVDQSTGELSLDAAISGETEQVQVSFDWFPEVAPLVIDLTDGVVDAHWDVDLSGLRLVRIHGSMDREDYGRFLNTRAAITSLTIDPAAHLDAEPWTTGTATTMPLADGGIDDDDYSLLVSVPADATHLRVGLNAYSDEGPATVVDLSTLAADDAGVLDLRHDSVTTATSPTLRVDARATGAFPCAVTSLWIDTTVWWFPSAPADTSNGDPSTWEGGENLGTRTLVPELWNQSGSNVWDLPSTSGWIYLDSAPWAGYAPGTFQSSWSGAQQLDGVWQQQAASLDLEASCQQQLLRVHGTYDGDADQYTNTRVVVTRYDMEPGNFIGNPPWRELSTTISPILPIASSPGQFETYVPLGEGTVFTVQVLPDGATEGPSSVFVRDELPDPNAPIVDVTVDPSVGRTVGIGMTPVGDPDQGCSAVSLWVDITLWWFPSAPGQQASGNPGDWPGAVPLGTRTLIPDLLDGGEGVNMWDVPEGPGFVAMKVDAWSHYGGLFTTGFGSSFDVPETGSFGFGWGIEAFGCAMVG